MPGYYPAGQFPVWGRLLAERLRRRWESRLLAFVASAAIRPPRANGYRSKSRERERRARLPRQGSRFGDGLPAGIGDRPDSVPRAALRPFLVRGWSSHFSFSVAFLFLLLTPALFHGR